MLRSLPGGSRSSAGPRFIAKDQRCPLAAFAGCALFVVPQPNAAPALDPKNMLGSTKQEQARRTADLRTNIARACHRLQGGYSAELLAHPPAGWRDEANACALHCGQAK
jgi:hypothetical protein